MSAIEPSYNGLYYLQDNWNQQVDSPILNKTTFVANEAIRTPKESSGRTSFIWNRLSQITITLGKKTSFTLEEFFTDGELRSRVIKKIYRIIIKAIERIWLTIRVELESLWNTIKQNKFSKNAEFVNNCSKFMYQIGKWGNNEFCGLGSISNCLSLVPKVLKIGDKINDIHEKKTHLTLHNVVSNVVDVTGAVVDIASVGTSLIEIIDSNDFMKMAYEALGFGKGFSPIASEVLEYIGTIDTCVFAPCRIFIKGFALVENIMKWSSYNPEESTESLSSIRFDVFKSIIDFAKEIAKTTINVLIMLGVLIKVPVVVTLALSGVGVFLLTIKIYQYFQSNNDSSLGQNLQNSYIPKQLEKLEFELGQNLGT